MSICLLMGPKRHKKAAKPAKEPNTVIKAAIADKLPQPINTDFHFQGDINDDEQAKLDLKLFWRLILETPGAPLKAKIEAARDYGKSLCMFPQKLEHTGKDGQAMTFNVIIGDKTDG